MSEKEDSKENPMPETANPAMEIPICRTAAFSKYYATRVMMSKTEFDFRAILANEKVVDEKGQAFYLSESMIILTPLAAKEVHAQLSALLEEWEKDKGKIEPRTPGTVFTKQVLS